MLVWRASKGVDLETQLLIFIKRGVGAELADQSVKNKPWD